MQLKWTGERVIPEIMDKNRAVVKEHLARYRWAMRFCRDKSVTDAACGSGYGTAMIAEITSKNVIGLDNSPEAIKYCEEKYNYCDNLHFNLIDLEEKIGAMDIFDVIISFETIEHLKDPSNFLKSVSRSTKLFLFSIPINLSGEFHKQVYDFEGMQTLIGKYFDNVHYLSQKGDIIRNKILPDAKFIIGVAKTNL